MHRWSGGAQTLPYELVSSDRLCTYGLLHSRSAGVGASLDGRNIADRLSLLVPVESGSTPPN